MLADLHHRLEIRATFLPPGAQPTSRATERPGSVRQKSAVLSDDSLIDAYHQAWEDHRDARAEGSDNLDKAGAESLATETAMRRRFHDYRTRYNERYP
jgi:hypothetical protein